MNTWLAVAAALTIFVGAAHSVLGERYILNRLQRFGLGVGTRRTLRFAWHLTTVAWWGAAALFWALDDGGARAGVHILSLTFLASSVVTAIGSHGRHLAWPVFAVIALAAWLGAPGGVAR